MPTPTMQMNARMTQVSPISIILRQMVGNQQEGDLKFNVSEVQVTRIMFLLRALMLLANQSTHLQTVNQLHNNWAYQIILLTMTDRMQRIMILHIATLRVMNSNSIVEQTLVLVPQVTSVYVLQVEL